VDIIKGRGEGSALERNLEFVYRRFCAAELWKPERRLDFAASDTGTFASFPAWLRSFQYGSLFEKNSTMLVVHVLKIHFYVTQVAYPKPPSYLELLA
jgi:hypothetical protein